MNTGNEMKGSQLKNRDTAQPVEPFVRAAESTCERRIGYIRECETNVGIAFLNGLNIAARAATFADLPSIPSACEAFIRTNASSWCRYLRSEVIC